MGYGKAQISDLQETIKAVDCDTVVIGTPIDLTRLINTDKPTVRVQYRLKEINGLTLDDVLRQRGFI